MYILDDHNEEGKFDAESFLRILRTSDEGSGDVGTHNFEYRRLNVLISNSLDVTVVDYDKEWFTLLLPNLEWFTADTVQDGQESWLVSVLEHLWNF